MDDAGGRSRDEVPEPEDLDAELERALAEIEAGPRFRWSALTGYQRWSLLLSPVVAIGCLAVLAGTPQPGLKVPFALLLVVSLLQLTLGIRQARRDQGLG